MISMPRDRAGYTRERHGPQEPPEPQFIHQNNLAVSTMISSRIHPRAQQLGKKHAGLEIPDQGPIVRCFGLIQGFSLDGPPCQPVSQCDCRLWLGNKTPLRHSCTLIDTCISFVPIWSPHDDPIHSVLFSLFSIWPSARLRRAICSLLRMDCSVRWPCAGIFCIFSFQL